MPELGWDIAETELLQETQRNNNAHMTLILQTIIVITTLLATFMKHVATYTIRIPKMAEKIAQAVKSMITRASFNGLFQNIKDSYKTAAIGPIIATTTHMTSRSTVSVNLTQRLNTETKTPKHKTLNIWI